MNKTRQVLLAMYIDFTENDVSYYCPALLTFVSSASKGSIAADSMIASNSILVPLNGTLGKIVLYVCYQLRTLPLAIGAE